MRDSGVRLTELANLKEVDVHLEDQWVKVLGQGSKERMVAFGVACQKTLLHYCFDVLAEPAHRFRVLVLVQVPLEQIMGLIRVEAGIGKGETHG